MADDPVALVRRFNRTVTQRVGALNDAFLARTRPLGQSRVLWEIGADGASLRDLRSRLDLDSGYLSRLLTALERDGLVRVRTAGADARVREATLTDAGAAEREELDRLSNDQARAILEPLSERQKQQLVEAMGVVERLLVASMVIIEPVDPASTAARTCLDQYFGELAERFDDGFEVDRSRPATDDDLREPAGVLLVAFLHGEPVACGAFTSHGDVADIKRMWVSPGLRGIGLGGRMLRQLESRARAHGLDAARLETNRALGEAIRMYRAAGYREVPAFNDEPYAHHWFEKKLEHP